MRSRADLSRLAAAMGGLPILGCLAGSPTDRAGVRYGDVLLAIDGKPTVTWDDFLEARTACGVGFTARIFRDGTEFDVQIDLQTMMPPRAPFELLEAIVATTLRRDLGARSKKPSN